MYFKSLIYSIMSSMQLPIGLSSCGACTVPKALNLLEWAECAKSLTLRAKSWLTCSKYVINKYGVGCNCAQKFNNHCLLQSGLILNVPKV